MIDPKKRAEERKEKGWSDDGPGTTFLRTAGKFSMMCVGWEYFQSSGKGTSGLMVRLVVVEGEHAGEVIDRNFWLTPNALDMLADFAGAFGYMEPFDEKDSDAIDKVTSRDFPPRLGVIRVTVQAEGYTKNDGSAGTRYEPKFFGPYKGEKKDSWDTYYNGGISSFEAYLAYRERNPRVLPGQQRMGGGGYQGQEATGGYQEPGTLPLSEDDIPF